ncbi:hypothetical protein HMPREF1316_0035 [Olsenella profusa F0195]|uniref:Uncharacterized protein n=1 Tax=Olsenella profusa F0195 TaxID=1125712 RepID=U2TPI1_9ACTN|nr:hypothetical protein HMPREF1316_0035 [Olsenella profusa F0195]
MPACTVCAHGALVRQYDAKPAYLLRPEFGSEAATDESPFIRSYAV